MQIAKLFAGLGFQVDTTGLSRFKKALAEARGEITNMSRGTKTATRQLRGFKTTIDQVSRSMAKIKGAGASSTIGQSYQNIATNARRLDTALNSIATSQKKYTNAIGKINSSVASGAPLWERYRSSVVSTRIALRNLNQDLARLRANSRVDIRIRNSGGSGGGGGNGGTGGGGGLGGLGSGMGAVAFMRNIVPMAGLGAAGGAGFAAKATVQAARDQTRMESTLLMTSKSQEEYANTLKYVRDESARLGLSSVELGKSYAQINMSAKGLDQNTKKEMFTGFSEFMMSMGTSADDQKGIFRAFNQMFSNNRLLQEEINQLSDRGIPATLVYDAAMKAYNTDSMAKIKKLQEDGKLDPNRVLPIMAKMVQDLAHDSGAYAKMMESSIVKQGKFMNQLSVTSKRIMDSGLDESLGKVFGVLTDLLPHIENISLALSAFFSELSRIKKLLNEVTGENTLLIGSLFLLLGRYKGLAKGIQVAVRVLGRKRGLLLAITAILRGVFGKALAAIIIRFGVWGVAIWAVSKAISFIGEQLKRGREGEFTFFDWIFHQVDMAIIKMDIFIARMALAWANIKALATSPVLNIAGEGLVPMLNRHSKSFVDNAKERLGINAVKGFFGQNSMNGNPLPKTMPTESRFSENLNARSVPINNNFTIINKDGSSTSGTLQTLALIG